MPLNYSSGYQSVRPINISSESSDPFGAALESINKRKEETEKRQQQLVSSREELLNDNYYGAHADVLNQASRLLIENEDFFATDDESAQKYKQAWAQLSELSDLFETFKTTTYGSPDDDPSASTFIAAEKRSRGIDPFYSEGLESSVGFDQMQQTLQGLNQEGLYKVTFDDDYNILVNGERLNEFEFGTSQIPFDPAITVADVSGARAFEGLWNTREITNDGIEAKMRVYLRNSENLSRAIKHHIQQSKRENPNYNMKVEDVIADPNEMEVAISNYIQEAKDYYQDVYTESKKPSASDVSRERKKDNFLRGITSGGNVEYVDGEDAAGDPIYSSASAEGLVAISSGTIYVDENDGGIYLIDNDGKRRDIGTGASDAKIRAQVERALRSESGGMTLNELYEELIK